MSDSNVNEEKVKYFLRPFVSSQWTLIIVALLCTIVAMIQSGNIMLGLYLSIIWFLNYYNLSCLVGKESCRIWGWITIIIPVIIVLIYLYISASMLSASEDYYSNSEVTGNWQGKWYQGDSEGEMELYLTAENGKLTGSGSDSVGEFEINGDISMTDISFDKQYIGKHNVKYAGTSSDGTTFNGTWNMNDSSSGEFEITKP